MEKISFSLKLFFDHFYWQSFIKTVRGPLKSLTQFFLTDAKTHIHTDRHAQSNMTHQLLQSWGHKKAIDG